MPKSFDYREIPRKEPLKPIRVPTIPVTLKSNGEQLKIVAMVDSGSDLLIIPKGIAEILKLKLDENKKEQVVGLGGGVDSYDTTVTITIPYEHESVALIAHARIVLTDVIPPLLGRKGFFERFEVTINEREKFVKIKDLGKY